MRKNSLITISIALIAIGLFACVGAFYVFPFPVLFVIIFLLVRAVKKSENERNTENRNTEGRNEEFRAEGFRREEFRAGENYNTGNRTGETYNTGTTTGKTYRTGPIITCDYCGSSVDTNKYACCNHCGGPYGTDEEWKEFHNRKNR